MQLLRELAWARRAGPIPEAVFRLFRPFHGPEFDRIFNSVMATETGRRILAEGKSLHPVLLDLETLSSMPENTLGFAYQEFMKRNEIDIVSFSEASLRHMAREDYAVNEAWILANRLRDIHEIVHVISGYGTDTLGEMCELAFFLHEDPRPGATRFAIRSNTSIFRRLGFTRAEETIQRAFERGSRAGSMVGSDWEAMMSWTLEEVRSHLDIDQPPTYRPIPDVGEPDLPTPQFVDGFRAALRLVPAP